MGNIKRERKKQSTLFKTLIIIALGLALITTVIVMLIHGNNDKPSHTMREKIEMIDIK